MHRLRTETEWGAEDRRRYRSAAHDPSCWRPSPLHKHDARYGAKEPTCGGSFLCARCGRLVGWCVGAHHDGEAAVTNDWCADCFVKWAEKRKRDEQYRATRHAITKSPGAADRRAVQVNAARRQRAGRKRRS